MAELLLGLLTKNPYTNLGARSKIGELANMPPAPKVAIGNVVTRSPVLERRLKETHEQRQGWWEQ